MGTLDSLRVDIVVKDVFHSTGVPEKDTGTNIVGKLGRTAVVGAVAGKSEDSTAEGSKETEVGFAVETDLVGTLVAVAVDGKVV